MAPGKAGRFAYRFVVYERDLWRHLMNTSQDLHDAVVVASTIRSEDLIAAHYDADTDEIVVSFQDGKVARVLITEFEELASATTVDYEYLDGT